MAFAEQAFTKTELEAARDAMEAGGVFQGLTTAERLMLTFQAARCKKMGGLLFRYTNGHLEKVDIDIGQDETG